MTPIPTYDLPSTRVYRNGRWGPMHFGILTRCKLATGRMSGIEREE